MDADAIARLKELAALKEAGILTEEEFSQQKAAILSGGGKLLQPRDRIRIHGFLASGAQYGGRGQRR